MRPSFTLPTGLHIFLSQVKMTKFHLAPCLRMPSLYSNSTTHSGDNNFLGARLQQLPVVTRSRNVLWSRSIEPLNASPGRGTERRRLRQGRAVGIRERRRARVRTSPSRRQFHVPLAGRRVQRHLVGVRTNKQRPTSRKITNGDGRGVNTAPYIAPGTAAAAATHGEWTPAAARPRRRRRGRHDEFDTRRLWTVWWWKQTV